MIRAKNHESEILNFELQIISQENNSLDTILLKFTLDMVTSSPKKILFRGKGAEKISSYVAGWMAGNGLESIVLDGANSFDPYVVSSLARKILIPPERLLKKILVARAFTCYQMATLMGERLKSFISRIRESHSQKTCVILLGPISTFLDEDVHERDARLLFTRSLREVDELAMGGIPIFLFQPDFHRSREIPFHGWRGRGKDGNLLNPREAYLIRRLFQFVDMVWRINLDDQGMKIILEKDLVENSILSPKHEILSKYRALGGIYGTNSSPFQSGS